MNNPKVWMIIPSFFPTIGGTESQVQNLTQLLLANGWSIRVITRQHNWAFPSGLPGGELIINNTPVTRIFSRGGTKIGSLLFLLGGLWYLLLHGQRSIYHAHDLGAAGWLAIVARYLLGGRCLIKLRTGREQYEKIFAGGLARWYFSKMLQLADRIVVVNSGVEQYLQNLGILTERIIFLPNAINVDHYYPVSSEEKFAAQQRLNLSPQKNIVLYVGRLQPVKGVDVLVRAWALVPQDIRHNSRLLLVGDGAEYETINRMAEALNITESVILVGRQEAVRDYYWASDIFVLPSRSEGQSNALVEAMACGLPVVASNVGGAPDIIKEGKNGVLFESENHEQFAQKLTSLLKQPDCWGQLGTCARQSVLSQADLTGAVSQLEEIYNCLGFECHGKQ